MKYYRISQETVDEIKRRLKIRNQMIKFYQNTLREQRESESLEEIGIGGFEPVEEDEVIDARDKSSMIPDMMATEEYHYPNSDHICSVYEQAMAKQAKESQDEKDRVIKDLQTQLYNQHQTIETLQKELDKKHKTKLTFDFYSTKDYDNMSREELIDVIHETTKSLKQLINDNNIKAEMINKASYPDHQTDFWKAKYEAAQKEIDKMTNGGEMILYEDHKADIKELYDKIYDLESLNHTLTAERDGLEASKDTVKKTYMHKIQELSDELNKTRNNYNKRIEELKAALEAEKAKTNSMMVLSEKVQSTAENYDSASKATIEDLQARIGRQSETIETLGTSNQCLSSKNRKLAATLDKMNADIDMLHSTIDKLNGMIGPKDYEDLKDRIFVVQSYAKDNSIRYYISIDKKEIQTSVKLAKALNKYFNLVIKEDNK